MRALDDVRIRTRLIAIFLLPILTLTIVAASQIQSSVAAGFKADKERQLLTFAIGLGDLTHELQLERDHSVNWVGSGKEAASYKEVVVQRAKVDKAIGPTGTRPASRCTRPSSGASPGRSRPCARSSASSPPPARRSTRCRRAPVRSCPTTPS